MKNFKLALLTNEDGELKLVKIYAEDQSVEPAPEYSVKNINGIPTIVFVDGVRVPVNERLEIVLAALEAAQKGENTFYLGPKYNSFVIKELEDYFFVRDEKGNKEFLTGAAEFLTNLLGACECIKENKAEEAHRQLLDHVIEDNEHTLKHLKERYGTENDEEALVQFVTDLLREPENPETPFKPSTGFAVEDVIGAAILGDGESILADNVIYRDGVLLITDLEKHENGNGEWGYWAGPSIAYDAPALRVDDGEVLEYDQPIGILFAIEDAELSGSEGIETYSYQLGDGILVAPVPQPEVEPLTAVEVSPLEAGVTFEEIESNPNKEGLGIYFDMTDKPQRSAKRIYWQWIGQDEQYSSVRTLYLTLDITKNPFKSDDGLEVEDDIQPAFLVDVDGEPSVYEEKEIEGDEITITGLKSHKAGNGIDGNWVGFAVIDKKGKADSMLLEVDGKAFEVNPLEEKVDGEHDGVGFYFTVEESGQVKKYVRYQWYKDGQASEIVEKVLTFNVTLA